MKRRKYIRPTSLQVAGGIPAQQQVVVEPTLGYDASQPPTDLKPGATPDSSNMIAEDGYLTPRSGLSNFGGSTDLLDIALFCTEHHSVDGSRYALIGSGLTLDYFDGANWSDISYVPTLATDDQLSGDSTGILNVCSVYDAATDENLAIITNNINVPKTWEPGSATYSDLSDFMSVSSFARVPYSLDNRLCFFNTASSTTTYATRVRWSERGLASNFSTYGAGFEDLMDMTGVGMGVAVREYDALLFSTEEVWLQQPRRDNFAFNFVALNRGIGCPYPKTIAKTPQGVIFMTRELEPYIVTGAQVSPIGPGIHQKLRDTILNSSNAFGLYNSKRQRYELYYDTGSTEGWCNKGIYLDMDRGSWLPIDLHDHSLGCGAEVGADLGSDMYWDGIAQTWDEIDTAWDDMVQETTQDKDVMVVSSVGTVYRFRDEQMTDDGSTITAYWTSHALSTPDPTHKCSLTEVVAEYKATDEGSYVLETRGSPAAAYTSASTYTYNNSPQGDRQYLTPFVTGDHPQFKITVSDAKRPRFGRFAIRTRDAGQF